MNSILLQKQLRDNANDLQSFANELKNWGDEMKRKESALKKGDDDIDTSEVPLPSRKPKSSKKADKKVGDNKKASPKPKKRLRTYADWDKFDVEKECAKLDDEERSLSPEDSDLTDEYDETLRDEAIYEKEKGNRFVKSQKWDDAIKCYTKAIDCYAYDPIFYANRALCYLKTENFKNAENDCTTALQLDKTYVKAYQRRAAARESLGQLSEAHSDLLKVFDYEPNNKESKIALSKIEKKLENYKKPSTSTETPRPVSKFTLSRQNKGNKTEIEAVNKESVKTQDVLKIHEAKVIEHQKEEPQPSTSRSVETKKVDTVKNVSFWPNHGEIELIRPIQKPPHLRSKKPLKRIEITETVQTKPTPPPPKADKIKIEEKNVVKTTEKADEIVLTIPQTSVQFHMTWKQIVDKPEMRYRYLSRIDPNKLQDIFKQSMETKVFSQILETLAVNFVENNTQVFDYLQGLSCVERFSALAMFMSEDDKSNFLKLIDFMRTDEGHSKDEVDVLIKKYLM